MTDIAWHTLETMGRPERDLERDRISINADPNGRFRGPLRTQFYDITDNHPSCGWGRWEYFGVEPWCENERRFRVPPVHILINSATAWEQYCIPAREWAEVGFGVLGGWALFPHYKEQWSDSCEG